MTYRVPLVHEVVATVLIQGEVHRFAYGRLVVLPQEWVQHLGQRSAILPCPLGSTSQRQKARQKSGSQAVLPYEGAQGSSNECSRMAKPCNHWGTTLSFLYSNYFSWPSVSLVALAVAATEVVDQLAILDL